jgi:hypothetical protein
MEKWLKCEISPGQFTGEYAVRCRMYDGTSFSLFAPRDCLEFDGEPSGDKPVHGKISVVVTGRAGNLCLINLPRPTFENGRTITVEAEQLH